MIIRQKHPDFENVDFWSLLDYQNVDFLLHSEILVNQNSLLLVYYDSSTPVGAKCRV